MVAAATPIDPPERLHARPPIGRILRGLARGVATVLCVSVIAVAALGTRTLVFEYTHGDRQIVLRLFESLLP
jgi:hypothetical protein